MAGLMWNHAPAMWSAIEKQGLAKPELTEQSAADLFAFFYAARYFDRTGDAGRGKQVFIKKNCAVCHNDPAMRSQMEARKLPWPRFSGTEMADLTAYFSAGPR
jgi:mono/diheme cytochrome c family protein